MKPTIFVVEDDPRVASLLFRTLEAENFIVRTFPTASAVLNPPRPCPPSLLLLEIGLPDKNGLDLCRELRLSPKWNRVPVIFVSEQTSETNRVAGLQLADDYITRPFGPRELIARVQAVLRRCHQPVLTNATIGDLELDTDLFSVVVRGQPVLLTTLEFRLLSHLVMHLGKASSRDEILDAVWDDRFVTSRIVDVYIRRIRKKIEADPDSPCYLKTVRGVGYRMVSPLFSSTPVPISSGRPNTVSLEQFPQSITA